MGHTASLDAYSGVRALDDVGGGQAAVQRRRDVQPVDGEALLQTFQQTGRRLRVLLVQPCGQLLDARDALVGVEFPGRSQQTFGLCPVVFGQVIEHIPLTDEDLSVGTPALRSLWARQRCTFWSEPKTALMAARSGRAGLIRFAPMPLTFRGQNLVPGDCESEAICY